MYRNSLALARLRSEKREALPYLELSVQVVQSPDNEVRMLSLVFISLAIIQILLSGNCGMYQYQSYHARI